MYSYDKQFLPTPFSLLMNKFILKTREMPLNHTTVEQKIKQFSILHQGPKMGSPLPRDLSRSTRIPSFKKALKKHFFYNVVN